jgi:hypothetical protein
VCAGIFRPIRLFNNAPFKGGFLPRRPVFNDKLFKVQKEFILGCHPFKFIKTPLLRRRGRLSIVVNPSLFLKGPGLYSSK